MRLIVAWGWVGEEGGLSGLQCISHLSLLLVFPATRDAGLGASRLPPVWFPYRAFGVKTKLRLQSGSRGPLSDRITEREGTWEVIYSDPLLKQETYNVSDERLSNLFLKTSGVLQLSRNGVPGQRKVCVSVPPDKPYLGL